MSTENLKPEVGSTYGYAWNRLWKYFLELFIIIIIGWLIGVPTGMGGWAGGVLSAAGVLGFFGFVYSILVVGPVEIGISYAYLKAARDEKVEIKDMFTAFNNYWNAVLASLLVGIIIIIGLFLLIIPGIYFACKLAFTPYLVVDRKMEVTEAIKESWRMTDGHAWTIFLIGLLGFVIALAGLIAFVVGVIIAGMWISLTMASFYHAVSSSQPTSAPHAA